LLGTIGRFSLLVNREVTARSAWVQAPPRQAASATRQTAIDSANFLVAARGHLTRRSGVSSSRWVYSGAKPVTTPIPARVLDLGLREFGEVWELQRQLVAARQRDEIPDTLLLVEHPDVLTLGRGTKRENLVRPGDLPVFEIERGGDVTYHGPGQLVGYPIFLLRPDERDLHAYLRGLEESLIRALGDLGLASGRQAGWTGVWNQDEPARKLASIGVAVKRWVTLHGFALNVATDLSRFLAINPCGLDAAVMGSLSQSLDRKVELREIIPPVVRHLGEVFGRAFAA
jgi:lipoyl(octanoyl) transferase